MKQIQILLLLSINLDLERPETTRLNPNNLYLAENMQVLKKQGLVELDFSRINEGGFCHKLTEKGKDFIDSLVHTYIDNMVTS